MSDEGIKPQKIEAIGKSGSGDMVVARRWEYHRKRHGGCRMGGLDKRRLRCASKFFTRLL
jgi:hypothetical protein